MLYPKVPLSVTFNPDFKGTPLFDAEYLDHIDNKIDTRLLQTSRPNRK